MNPHSILNQISESNQAVVRARTNDILAPCCFVFRYETHVTTINEKIYLYCVKGWKFFRHNSSATGVVAEFILRGYSLSKSNLRKCAGVPQNELFQGCGLEAGCLK